MRDLFLFTSPTCEKRAICDRLSDAIGIVHAMSCHGTVTAVFGCFRPFQVPITPSIVSSRRASWRGTSDFTLWKV